MSTRGLLSLLTFAGVLRDHDAFFFSENDVTCSLDLPVHGCSCTNDMGLVVMCNDLDLKRWPDFSSLEGNIIDTLDISGNNFKNIPKDAFGNLEIRHLKFSHNSRAFQKVHAEAFNSHQRNSLESLDISYSRWDRIPDMIWNLGRLTELDLKGNDFLEIRNKELVGLYNLTALHFGVIERLDTDVFEECGRLQLLEISPKVIYEYHSLAWYFFDVKNTIRLMDLQTLIVNSGVVTFGPMFLGNMMALRHLEITRSALDDSQLQRVMIPDDHGDMNYVNLADNLLQRVPGLFLSTFDGLEHLDLSGNRISRVLRHSFRYNLALRVINLRNNRIKTIKRHALAALAHLQDVDLRGNRLSQVSERVFPAGFQQNLVLLLAQNRWVCDCRWWLMDLCRDQHLGATGPLDLYEVENELTCYNSTAASSSRIRLYEVTDTLPCSGA